jgi:GT2 family glycosyltransferase
MSVRRTAVLDAGGFDETLGGTALLEDAEVSLRLRAAGWTLRFEPAAEVHHRSAPVGGVRVRDRLQTERWRFENTAAVVRRARGRHGMLAAAPVLAALAVERGLRWRAPGASWTLLSALARGWRRGAAAPR